jgi:hypothetical protein
MCAQQNRYDLKKKIIFNVEYVIHSHAFAQNIFFAQDKFWKKKKITRWLTSVRGENRAGLSLIRASVFIALFCSEICKGIRVLMRLFNTSFH